MNTKDTNSKVSKLSKKDRYKHKIEECENPTYYRTIVNSDIWKKWTEYAEDNLLYDMPESIECGWLSDKHWNSFIKWVRENKEQ